MTEDLWPVYRRFIRNSEALSLNQYSLEQYELELRQRFSVELAARGVGNEKLSSAICYAPGGLILKFETKEVDFDEIFNAKYK